MTKKRILMCPATHYGLNYEINPWMHKDNQPNRDKAVEQQNKIIESLSELGHTVELIEPATDCPDMCFTANAGVVRDGKVLLANLPAERQPEHPYFEKWFTEQGYSVQRTAYRFGGGGDALWVGDKLIAAYGPKDRRASDIEVHTELEKLFDVEVTSIQTTDERFYDMDMVVAVLRPNLIAICSEVLTDESVQKLKGMADMEVIDVALQDALGFGCNLISDGENVLISNRAPGLIAQLRDKGFNVLPHSIGQFMLTGGGVRCLGLDLPL